MAASTTVTAVVTCWSYDRRPPSAQSRLDSTVRARWLSRLSAGRYSQSVTRTRSAWKWRNK